MGTLHQEALRRIEQRRSKLNEDERLIGDLGYPVVAGPRSTAGPRPAPVKRRPKITRPPEVSSGGNNDGWYLEKAEYEHIIRVISHMAYVMERSPATFAKLSEEDLRQHILVQLNGHYLGSVTAETFNFEGKTDLLIRHEGRNVFIGECKFWTGPVGLGKTIDQLLGYTQWRDTKTAVILFNRNQNFTQVLAEVPRVVEAHPSYRQTLDYPSETGFRYIMHNRDDPNRELTMTVLVFDVRSDR